MDGIWNGSDNGCDFSVGRCGKAPGVFRSLTGRGGRPRTSLRNPMGFEVCVRDDKPA